MTGNIIGSDGAKAIFQSEYLKLQRLSLRRTGVLMDAFLEIASYDNMRYLQVLELCENRLGNAVAKAIADAKNFSHLQSLSLGGTDISDVGVLEIVYSENLKSLSKIYCIWASRDNISDDAIKLAKLRFGENI